MQQIEFGTLACNVCEFPLIEHFSQTHFFKVELLNLPCNFLAKKKNFKFLLAKQAGVFSSINLLGQNQLKMLYELREPAFLPSMEDRGLLNKGNSKTLFHWINRVHICLRGRWLNKMLSLGRYLQMDQIKWTRLKVAVFFITQWSNTKVPYPTNSNCIDPGENKIK